MTTIERRPTTGHRPERATSAPRSHGDSRHRPSRSHREEGLVPGRNGGNNARKLRAVCDREQEQTGRDQQSTPATHMKFGHPLIKNSGDNIAGLIHFQEA